MFAGADAELGGGAYRCEVAAPRAGAAASSSGLAVYAKHSFAHIEGKRLAEIDTLVIVGGDARAIVGELRRGAIRSITQQAAGRVRRIVSVCTGAFLLADAGLLDGRRAATHWASAEELKRFRPAVDVDADSIFVFDPPIYTSAGVTAGIDLALALIETDHGREIALAVARRHVVSRMRSGGQAQFSSELAAQASEDKRLSRLMEAIRKAPNADWRIESLVHTAGVSPRTLSRLFRQELRTTPATYVERVRVDAARRELIETDQSVEWVADRCGFASLRQMDRAFSRCLGTAPREFRQRFSIRGNEPARPLGAARSNAEEHPL